MRFQILEDKIVISKLFGSKEILYSSIAKVHIREEGTEITLRDGSKVLMKTVYLRSCIYEELADSVFKYNIDFKDDYSDEEHRIDRDDTKSYIDSFVERSNGVLVPVIKKDLGEEYDLDIEIVDEESRISAIFRIKCNGEVLTDMPGYDEEVHCLEYIDLFYLYEFNQAERRIVYFGDEDVFDEDKLSKTLIDFSWKYFLKERESALNGKVN